MVRKKYFVLAVCSLFVMTGCSGGLHTEMESAVIMEADITTESASDSPEDISTIVEDSDIESSEDDSATDKNVSAEDKSAEEKISEENQVAEATEVKTTKADRKENDGNQKTAAKSSETETASAGKTETDDRGNPADGSPLYEITITKPETEPVGYSADRVAELAIIKCKAAGMITLPENLDSMLAAGEITQEEYEEYYPYDGCGYYSVFVETDLNAASTISGRKLGSEKEIADYIAGMMVLEREPYFYIECAGIYKNNGTEFYEFRCYR